MRKNVSVRLARTKQLIASLPAPRRELWARKLALLEHDARTTVGATEYVDFEQRRASDAESSKSTMQRIARGELEWDLTLANELDAIFTAVQAEAAAVKRAIDQGIQDTGWALTWPLGLLVVATLYLWKKG